MMSVGSYREATLMRERHWALGDGCMMGTLDPRDGARCKQFYQLLHVL